MLSIDLAKQALLLLCLTQAGCLCVSSAKNSIPATRLPVQLAACSKTGLVPLDLTLLRQEPPPTHVIGPGDILGAYIGGVIPAKVDEAPIVMPPLMNQTRYYPPTGVANLPNFGLPLTVSELGTLEVPLIDPIQVEGLTLKQAVDAMRKAFIDKKVIPEGKERIFLNLLKPRVHRIMVLRDDTMIPQLIPPQTVPYTKRGQGEVIDLPAYENDVLHALAQTNGLPGLDVYNEVWVLKSKKDPELSHDEIKAKLEEGADINDLLKKLRRQSRAIRIPLRIYPDQPVNFTEDDIVLNEGDILYLGSRDNDVFYTGGQLPGRRVPLPRDHDIDVVEAIGLANGSVGGPGAINSVFRTGPGIVFPPTRAIVVRKLPNEQQVTIRVDLARALHDKKERILIQPQDQILVFYKPGELWGNLLLNYVGFGLTIVPQTN